MWLTIDDKQIEAHEGMTVLNAALGAGIYIPHLCGHPDLEAVGGCRLCSVEIEGMTEAVPSCMIKVEEGMKVTVHGSKAEKTRKTAMELILATHPADCTGCPKYGKCELQSMYQYLGVGPEKWKKKTRTVPTDDSNPLIRHLFTRCVRCGRCVRACRELRGVKVLDFQKTEDGVRIGTDGNISLKEAGCKFCGACIEVCPTGSIMDALGQISEDVSYAEGVVPCRTACPAHTDIPRYLRYIKEGDYEKATAVIREKLPFPETLGCICSHVCETACKHNELGKPLSICKLKRAAAASQSDEWKKNRKTAAPTGKKAAVIGAGPAGLTAAYYLAKKGHEVTVFESNEKAGGQCRYGIPAYRLPDEVLDREISDILEVGVDLKVNTTADTPENLLKQGYDTVLIATGTHKGVLLPLEGNNLSGVQLNTDFLKHARRGQISDPGKKVMVLGGGNVAFDCARTALRLGAEEVHIACLESRDNMTASIEEIEEGREEGIILHSGYSFLRITGDMKVQGVELQKVDKFYFDENRKAIIELIEGSQEIIPVDHVIFAVGQAPLGTEKLGVELYHGSYVKVDSSFSTSLPGVYGAGDVVTGTKSVIEAIAAGRQSAIEMDRYLGGDGDISEELLEKETADPFLGRTEDFGSLERLYPSLLDPQERKKSFAPVEQTFTCGEAKCEAGRCLQCDLRLNLTNPRLWNEY
ncbi:FAD-dependent oxidoreductase [Lacrimispora aerotolerans]|jgi:NADPH-dependent glutamate synthase beta subunit-like oxidoreductase/ferredoxin|uniref:FAD-dependent oxidoreductase n=1 Tax=Lacrimispora aerotolerans TaxID=36832 RepID=UPI0004789F11|nr:FAD-dependent oxidoreductase [Lacrimispora aerotolerans]